LVDAALATLTGKGPNPNENATTAAPMIKVARVIDIVSPLNGLVA